MRPDRASVPQLVAGLTVTIIFLAVLSIVLTAAGPDGLGLTERRTGTWIVAVYGLPMIPSLVLSVRRRQPLMLTGNVFALIFFLSLGDRVGIRRARRRLDGGGRGAPAHHPARRDRAARSLDPDPGRARPHRRAR